jgi:hypothetical protein
MTHTDSIFASAESRSRRMPTRIMPRADCHDGVAGARKPKITAFETRGAGRVQVE